MKRIASLATGILLGICMLVLFNPGWSQATSTDVTFNLGSDNHIRSVTGITVQVNYVYYWFRPVDLQYMQQTLWSGGQTQTMSVTYTGGCTNFTISGKPYWDKIVSGFYQTVQTTVTKACPCSTKTVNFVISSGGSEIEIECR